jgi:hypothetical protein
MEALSGPVSSIGVMGEVPKGRYTVMIASHPAAGRELTAGQATGEACISCNGSGEDGLLPVGVIVPPVSGTGIAMACPACVAAVLAL